MENEKIDVKKIWDNANQLMVEGKFLEAAIQYDIGIKNGFVQKYSDGDCILFNAAIARALTGDLENAESKFKQFILHNIVVYISKGYSYQTSISGILSENFNDYRSNINGIGLRLRFLDTQDNNKGKGYLKQLLFNDILEWWKIANVKTTTSDEDKKNEESLKSYIGIKKIADSAYENGRNDEKKELIIKSLKRNKLTIEEISEDFNITIDSVIEIQTNQKLKPNI
jgi:hypothetical protein